MPNRLSEEQSPYLLQHAHNPVDWYPWGDEAFEKAAAEHKPVIVSIGYAACHWCHVMERESFEEQEVAAYMNEHFVCIKVDREEHPDVDHLYMDAVQAISGSGGWPLNVFATPGRVPFFGGTYYPPRAAYNRPSWMQILRRMSDIWEDQPEEVAQQAEQMLQYLRKASEKTSATQKELTPDSAMCRKIAENLLKMADKEKGGFGGAPKFPGTMAISFLIEHYHFTGDEPALAHALLSLDAMIAGGIYDQLGGGFARYATDRNWLAPHFEKMLYDNALLVSALCDAYHITKEEHYKTVIEDTLAFAQKELDNKQGGYYCAIDADSEGAEGKFYTWTPAEWDAVAGDANGIAAQYFGIVPGGNWEDTNILHVAATMEDIARARGISLQEVKSSLAAVKERLRAEREKRIRPITDDKTLLPWNALMNISLCRAGIALNNENYLQRATAHMQWLLAAFAQDGGLLHAWKNGTAKIPAKLDGYAYLIQALLQLASATGNNEWIPQAAGLMEQVLAAFGQDDLFFYYTPEGQAGMPVRKVDLYDGATPSANAVMAHNLWLLGMCMERSEWIDRAARMLRHMADTAMRYSYSFGYWLMLLQRSVAGLCTVVSAGPGAGGATARIRANYVPEALFITFEKEIFNVPILENKKNADALSIFVCSETACLPPVSSVSAAIELLSR